MTERPAGIDWTAARGSPVPPPAPHALRPSARQALPAPDPQARAAATLDAELEPPDLNCLRLDGLEVVRRVGVRVRTPEWGTVAPRVDQVEIERRGRETEARFEVAHRDGPIAFSWAGAVSLGERSLTYEMDGIAERAFPYARVGLVILHPPAVTAGRPFRARGKGGSVTSGGLPELVGPQLIVENEVQPLFPAFDQLEIELTPDLRLHIELEGDLFEMEDQRNWTDASFKTYSTPVGLPIPHYAEERARLRQRVRFEFRGRQRPRSRSAPRSGPAAGAGPPPSHPWSPRSGTQAQITLAVEPGKTSIPPFGTSLPNPGQLPPADLRAHINELRPAHLRLAMSSGDDVRRRLAEAFEIAAEGGPDVELGLWLPADEPGARRRLADVAAHTIDLDRPPIRTTLAREGEPVTTGGTARIARDHLPELTLLGGSPTNFAELNRDPPPPDAPIDGLYFAANPQMHDTDDRAVMLSPLAQRDAVLTASRLPGERPVHLSPVSLSRPGAPHPDPRQRALFAGAWLVASAAALIGAGAASVTWSSLAGFEGLIDTESGRPFPSYHVLRELCAWRGRTVVTAILSDAEALAAVASTSRSRGELRTLIANLTASEAHVELDGLGQGLSLMALAADGFGDGERGADRIALGPYEVALLSAPSRG